VAEREPLLLAPGRVLPEHCLRAEFARSGGPGGQNVNKVETKVVLRFQVGNEQVFTRDEIERLRRKLGPKLTREGELIVSATEHRSRERNMEAARQRLLEILVAALHVPRSRRATRPSRGGVRRRLQAKSRRSEVKHGRRNKEEE